MSQENVEIVRRGFEAFVSGNLDVAFAMLAPNVRWDPADAEPCSGRDEVERFMRLAGTSGPKLEAEEFIDGGDRVIVCLRRSARDDSGAFEGPARTYTVVDLRNGTVIELRGYLERDQALEAAGLSE
jgi:ketosteroid isomerase-like protein